VYPYGASLNIQDPALAILSSGPLSYPINRPIAGVLQARGKLAVCGSFMVFSDEYFDKEENTKLFEFFIKFLLTSEVELEKTNNDQGIQDYTYVPEISELAENLKSCLEQPHELPKDFTQLFEENLFKFTTDLIPEAVQLY
jgi:intraflagellar transport protein 52